MLFSCVNLDADGSCRFSSYRGLRNIRYSGLSLTTARSGIAHSEISGCGVREGVAADAATNFIWGMCTGGGKALFDGLHCVALDRETYGIRESASPRRAPI